MNIDLGPRALVDLALDLREPFPLPDACADLIHGEHVFEHLAHPRETVPFLLECRRVLRPGGRLSLSVPDAGEVLHAYVAADEAFFASARAWGHPPEESITPMAQVNYVFRQGNEHQYAYDADTLRRVVADAGFVTIVCPREFDSELDSVARQAGGLRLVARRP